MSVSEEIERWEREGNLLVHPLSLDPVERDGWKQEKEMKVDG